MIKSIWLNIPVKDVNSSREFFTKIGFKLNPHYGNGEHSASFLVGEKEVVLMLFPESTFKGFTGHEISDAKQGTEVLFSIDTESPEELDEITSKAEAAGGTVYGKPGWRDGWMYGSGFIDLDGHRWNLLYMDFSKMPQG